MASTLFRDLYDETTQAEDAFEKQVVPAGTYDVIVESARAYTGGKSPMIFLTLAVLNGPLQGKKSDVGINFSDSPNARPFFIRKVAGLRAYEDVKAASRAAEQLDEETGFQTIAASFTGKTVSADIGFGSGQYADQNELKSTKVIAGNAVQAAAPAVQAAPVQQPAPVQQAAALPFVPAEANPNGTASVPF